MYRNNCGCGIGKASGIAVIVILLALGAGAASSLSINATNSNGAVQEVQASTLTTAGIIYVPDDYSTIQWAVDNASAGDMIIVHNRSYIENMKTFKARIMEKENNLAIIPENVSHPHNLGYALRNQRIVENLSVLKYTLSSNTRYVNPGQSIQDAIDAANPGDTIIVRDGVYIGNIDVYKSLIIKSKNGSTNCIVQAADENDNVFEVYANNVTIRGFTIKGATGHHWEGDWLYGYCGILIDNANHCNISDNNISNNTWGLFLNFSNNSVLANNLISKSIGSGISLDNASNNIVSNNTARLNGWDGLSLWSSSDNIITTNTASYNEYDGIWLDDSSNNILKNNSMSGNEWGIDLDSSSNNKITSNIIYSNNADGINLLDSSNNNTISNNTANSNGLLDHWGGGIRLGDGGDPSRNVTDNIVTGNTASNNSDDGIGLEWSEENIVTDNTVNSNGAEGISLYHSNHSIISNNTASNNNNRGIGLFDSNYNTISNNNASLNDDTGIKLDYSSYNQLTNNTLSENGDFGIWLRRSPYNVLRGNVMDHNGAINLMGKETPIVEEWDNDIDTSNTVNGVPVYFIYNQSDLVIDNYVTKKILVVGCNNITVRNICYCDGDPISLIFTNNSLVENNTVTNNNAMGFVLVWSHYNKLTNNNASYNGVGFTVQVSTHNNITNNIVKGNAEGGIKLSFSASNNRIYNNYLNNTNNAYDDGNNIWNSTSKITYTYNSKTYTNYTGNYWSDYIGSDGDGDGIGDTPYSIDGDKDNYPLMERFENYIQPEAGDYDPADTNQDCVVDMMELMAHISKWKSGEVGMMELMTSIGRWKLGAEGYC